MACERDPFRSDAQPWRIRSSDGARGGPDGHRRRPRHPPAADHLRLDRYRQRRNLPRAARPSHPPGAARLAGSVHRPAGRLRLGGHHWLAVRGRGADACRVPRAPGRPGRHPGAARSQAARQTDRIDARHLRELLGAGTLPESWMPPAELPAVARQAVEGALGMIDQLEVELDRLDGELAGIARVQPGCQALQRRYGVGWLTAVAIWAEFGDVRRFANSRQAVRFTGLDITIAESDGKRARGHLARQGSPVLRWALHEAAMCAARPSSPDHGYYLQVRQRLGGKRAALSVARKLAREAYHTLRELGDQALVPAKLPTAA